MEKLIRASLDVCFRWCHLVLEDEASAFSGDGPVKGGAELLILDEQQRQLLVGSHAQTKLGTQLVQRASVAQKGHCAEGLAGRRRVLPRLLLLGD